MSEDCHSSGTIVTLISMCQMANERISFWWKWSVSDWNCNYLLCLFCICFRMKIMFLYFTIDNGRAYRNSNKICTDLKLIRNFYNEIKNLQNVFCSFTDELVCVWRYFIFNLATFEISLFVTPSCFLLLIVECCSFFNICKIFVLIKYV